MVHPLMVGRLEGRTTMDCSFHSHPQRRFRIGVDRGLPRRNKKLMTTRLLCRSSMMTNPFARRSRLAKEVWLRSPGVLFCRRVSGVRLSAPDQLPGPRYRHAGHVRAGSATENYTARVGDSIVFITASLDKAERPHLLEQGAVGCLFKPFSDAVLLKALNAALRLN